MQPATRRFANPKEVDFVRWLFRLGLNNCQISRITGIPRATFRYWRSKPPAWPRYRTMRDADGQIVPVGYPCPLCHGRPLDEAAYSYLLGLYLGDGCISPNRGRKFILRIACSDAYPHLLALCREAIRRVRGGDRIAGKMQRVGCSEVYSSWIHWPCLFPQHGPGRKHERPIRLLSWQEEIVGKYPRQLVRGLIHSDGYRGLNYVGGKGYPRYQFSNSSGDIRRILCDQLDRLDVRWRRMKWNTVSVARRPDVAKLDLFIGPKR